MNKYDAIILLRKDPKNIHVINWSFRDDKECMKELVYCDEDYFIYASDRLKNDEEYILELIKINGHVLRYASVSCLDNYKLAHEALKTVDIFEHLSNRLQNTRQIVTEAIMRNGLILESVSETYTDDFQIVMLAVYSNPWSIIYASDRLRDNKEIIRTAIKKDAKTFEFASNYLLENLEMVFYAMTCDASCLIYSPLNNNKRCVWYLVLFFGGYIMNFLSERLYLQSNYMMNMYNITHKEAICLMYYNTCILKLNKIKYHDIYIHCS